MAIEMEIKEAWSTRDAGAGGKRKESQSSSSSGKKLKASSSQGFQSRSHQSKGQARVPSQAVQTICYFFNKPGHMKWNCP